MSTPNVRYPRVGDLSLDARTATREALKARGYERMHSEVAVVWEEGSKEEIYCGDNWCTGRCGLPALIIPLPPSHGESERFLKASGTQVACGPMMQPLRVEWHGDRVEVPKEHREDFIKRWYL